MALNASFLETLFGTICIDGCMHRHWDVQSEAYTGADSLLTLIDQGWSLSSHCFKEAVSYQSRCSFLYHFQLHRDDASILLRVTHNPMVDRLILHMQVDTYQTETLMDSLPPIRQSQRVITLK